MGGNSPKINQSVDFDYNGPPVPVTNGTVLQLVSQFGIQNAWHAFLKLRGLNLPKEEAEKVFPIKRFRDKIRRLKATNETLKERSDDCSTFHAREFNAVLNTAALSGISGQQNANGENAEASKNDSPSEGSGTATTSPSSSTSNSVANTVAQIIASIHEKANEKANNAAAANSSAAPTTSTTDTTPSVTAPSTEAAPTSTDAAPAPVSTEPSSTTPSATTANTTSVPTTSSVAEATATTTTKAPAPPPATPKKHTKKEANATTSAISSAHIDDVVSSVIERVRNIPPEIPLTPPEMSSPGHTGRQTKKMFQNLPKQPKSKAGALPAPPPPQPTYPPNPLASPGLLQVQQLPPHHPQQIPSVPQTALPARPLYGMPQDPGLVNTLGPQQMQQPLYAVMQLPPNTRFPMQIQNMPRMQSGGGETVIISNFNEIFRNGGQLSIIPTTTVEAPQQQVTPAAPPKPSPRTTKAGKATPAKLDPTTAPPTTSTSDEKLPTTPKKAGRKPKAPPQKPNKSEPEKPEVPQEKPEEKPEKKAPKETEKKEKPKKVVEKVEKEESKNGETVEKLEKQIQAEQSKNGVLKKKNNKLTDDLKKANDLLTCAKIDLACQKAETDKIQSEVELLRSENDQLKLKLGIAVSKSKSAPKPSPIIPTSKKSTTTPVVKKEVSPPPEPARATRSGRRPTIVESPPDRPVAKPAVKRQAKSPTPDDALTRKSIRLRSRYY